MIHDMEAPSAKFNSTWPRTACFLRLRARSTDNRTHVKNLESIPAFRPDGLLNIVVETPRGSRVKLAYSPELQTFEATRALALGVTYPYDWGFVPGTRAEDGDPLDALVLHHEPTYPGVVLPCEPVGVIVLSERANKKKEGRQSNNRLIVTPHWQSGHRSSADIAARTRAELEQFFL